MTSASPFPLTSSLTSLAFRAISCAADAGPAANKAAKNAAVAKATLTRMNATPIGCRAKEP